MSKKHTCISYIVEGFCLITNARWNERLLLGRMFKPINKILKWLFLTFQFVSAQFKYSESNRSVVNVLRPPLLRFLFGTSFPLCALRLKYISKKKKKHFYSGERSPTFCFRTNIMIFPSNMSAAICVKSRHQHCTLQRDMGGTSLCTLE